MDWEALYQQGDTAWDRGEASPALSHWLEQGVLEAWQRVLIPACGRGHEVLELAKRGFDVTGLDIASTALTYLQQALADDDVKATTVHGDIFDYQPEENFDVVYEQTCMCAIEPVLRKAYVDCLYYWLKPGGYLCFSMMQTGQVGGPPFHCDWLDMQALLTDEKWQWQQEPAIVIPRNKQSNRFELGFVLRRKGSAD